MSAEDFETRLAQLELVTAHILKHTPLPQNYGWRNDPEDEQLLDAVSDLQSRAWKLEQTARDKNKV